MRFRTLPRFLALVAPLVIVLHVLVVVFLGTTPAGSLAGNGLQVFSSFLAATLCFGAARRGSGFIRSFWILVGCGIGAWGVADLGWTYYEVVLHVEPPPGSMTRFLFNTQSMFFVMAIFLDQEKKDSRVELSEALDFLQIGLLFFLAYLGSYYLPAISFGTAEALARQFRAVTYATVGIFLLVTLQWRRSSTLDARRLFGGLTLYIAVYGTFSTLTTFLQNAGNLPTGTWYDLGWTIPLLFAVFWAGDWQPIPESISRPKTRNRTLGELLITNGMFLFAPMVILIQVAQPGSDLRGLRFTILGISFICYAARIGLTQFRQQQHEETERRQAQAMDSSIEGIGILNEKGVHIYGNAALAAMLGFESPEHIVGQPWRIVYAFQQIAALESEVREALQASGKWSGSLLLRRPDGSRLPVEMHVGLMPDGGTLCITRDLSQHQQAEKARAEAEAKFRMLVEHVNAITYIAEIGIHGRWYYVSPQVEDILGYTPEEWLAAGRDWDQHIHPDDLPVVVAAEEQSQLGMPFQAEFRIRRKDGRDVWLSDTAVIVQGSDSHPVMEGIMVDITERKALETQLQQSRKMEAVGRLAGGIAHDFNNLLTIISGYNDLALSRSSIPLEIRGDIERIENASGRAAALVRQLLAFSRKQVLQPKTIDLNEVVLNLDKLLRRLMDDNIQMNTHTQNVIGKVKADPAQIEQVIMNLVVNARDAMPGGGRILLETSNVDLDSDYADDHVTVKTGKYVMLAVSDTGVGMSQQTIAHIFEPFYTTKESGSGTGLGLSTVYGIVKQSGGYIWVYSEPGKGSTFKVYLPRVAAQVEAKPEVVELPAVGKGSETILLVEDEEAVRELASRILSAKGYAVVAAKSTKEAEQFAEKHGAKIHLLLTDIIMPGTSGRELAQRITARHPKTRVLYMSGYTDNVLAQ